MLKKDNNHYQRIYRLSSLPHLDNKIYSNTSTSTYVYIIDNKKLIQDMKQWQWGKAI